MEYDSRAHGLWGDRKRAGSTSAMDQKVAKGKLENHFYRDRFWAHRVMGTWHRPYVFALFHSPFQTTFFMSFSRFFCGCCHFIILLSVTQHEKSTFKTVSVADRVSLQLMPQPSYWVLSVIKLFFWIPISPLLLWSNLVAPKSMIHSNNRTGYRNDFCMPVLP